MIIAFLLFISAVVMEGIDTSLGMMYGTIMTPLLVTCGYNPKVVVPTILLSQAIGGFAASWQHHRVKNASLNVKSRDFKIAAIIVLLGSVATFVGVYAGKIVPKTPMTIYIGTLVAVMGYLVIKRPQWTFSWKKIVGLGALSSFNKAFSGGGFGPIVVGGQLLQDLPGKNSIGTTDFAEAPVCLMGFLLWWWMNQTMPGNELLIPMCVGAGLGGLIGPNMVARYGSSRFLVDLVGWTAIILGIITLGKLFI